MKFRCKTTGTIVEFKEAHDIESMLKEEHYEVVEEKKEEVKPKPKKAE